MRLLSIILFLFLGFCSIATAQEYFETDSQIYFSAVSENNEFLAFVDRKNIYILKTNDLTKINLIPYSLDSSGAVSQLFFKPNDNSALFVRFSKYGGKLYPSEKEVYPSDSLIQYNALTGEKIASYHGTIQVSFNKETNDFIIYANDYYPFYFEGKTYYMAGNGLFIYSNKKQLPLTKTIKQVNVSPDNKLLALSYIEDNKYYSLEIRDFKTFELVAQKGAITEIPMNLKFSTDSKFLLFEYVEKRYYRNPISLLPLEDLKVKILNTQDLEEASDRKHIVFQNKLINNTLFELKDGSVTLQNLETKKVEHEIYPMITKLFDITNAIWLDEDTVIVFGPVRDQLGLYSEKGGVEKISISNLEIYSKNISVNDFDTIFNPNSIFIQNNKFNGGNIFESYNKNITLSINEGNIQIWNHKDRKKIHEFNFKKFNLSEPSAFLDFDNNLLVFEALPGKNFSDYIINIIELKTGVSRSFASKDNSIDFNPSYGCSCIPNKEKFSEWLCSDGGNSLWQISAEHLAPKKVFELQEESRLRNEIVSFKAIPNSTYAYAKIEKISSDTNHDDPREESLIFISLDDFTYQKIENLGDSKFFEPLDLKSYLIVKNQSLVLINSENKSKVQILDLTNKHIVSLSRFEETLYFAVENKISGDSVEVYNFSIANQSIISKFKIPPFTSQIFSDNRGVSYAAGPKISKLIFENNSYINWTNDFFEKNYTKSYSFDKNGNLLYNNSLWIDLKTLDHKMVIPSYFHATFLSSENNGNIIYIAKNLYKNDDNPEPNFEIVIAPIENYKNFHWKSEKISLPKNTIFGSNKISVSSSGKFAAIYSEFSSIISEPPIIYLLNIHDKTIKNLEFDQVVEIYFSEDDKIFGVKNFNKNNEIEYFLYDLNSGKLIKKSDSDFELIQNQNGEYLKNELQGVRLSKLENGTPTELNFFYSRDWIKNSIFLESKKMICGGSETGKLYFWNYNKSSPVHTVNLGNDEIQLIEERNNNLYVFFKNGTVKIVDLINFKEQLQIVFNKNEDDFSPSWFTPEGYFFASKSELNNYHLVKGLQVFPLLTYELYLNRPDIILENTGFGDHELINLFNSAFQKRLGRHNVDLKADLFDRNLPSVNLKNKYQLPITTNNDSCRLEILATSAESNLAKLHVNVNGVPIYGIQGKLLKPTKKFEETINLNLISGTNRISILVEDSAGLESILESVTIENLKVKDSKVYYVGVGVSSYLDSSMDLRFAHSDIETLNIFFEEQFEEKLTTVTFLNDQAIADNIMSVKELLKQTEVDDIVIFSFSGHGLLDGENNFYFATHDIDFSNPKGKGLSYEKIQELFDNIQAKRKLILIDACHSGEVDETDNQLIFESKSVSEFQPKGAIALENTSNVSLQNSFRLMKTMFSDLNRSNGAFVISAAGGKEYAFETDQLGGVFTNSFISAFKEIVYADRNSKYEVKISELQKRIYTKVEEATQGRQKPTSRNENSEWDWALKNSKY